MTDNQDEEHDEMALRLPDGVTRRVNDLMNDLVDREERTVIEKLEREELERTDPRTLN